MGGEGEKEGGEGDNQMERDAHGFTVSSVS